MGSSNARGMVGAPVCVAKLGDGAESRPEGERLAVVLVAGVCLAVVGDAVLLEPALEAIEVAVAGVVVVEVQRAVLDRLPYSQSAANFFHLLLHGAAYPRDSYHRYLYAAPSPARACPLAPATSRAKVLDQWVHSWLASGEGRKRRRHLYHGARPPSGRSVRAQPAK